MFYPEESYGVYFATPPDRQWVCMTPGELEEWAEEISRAA